MAKKILMATLLATGLLTAQTADVAAHLAGWAKIGSKLIHVSSFKAVVGLKVRNADKDPAAVTFEAFISDLEILCENPNNNNVIPGEAGIQAGIGVLEPIVPEHIVGKGKAVVEIYISDEDLLGLVSPANCVNPNWIPIEALPRALTARIESHECTGVDENGECTAIVEPEAWFQTLECVLPQDVQLGFDPEEDVEYVCEETDSGHVF